MDGNAERVQAKARSLADILSVIGLAAEGAIGPSAPRVMYFAAKDLGTKEGIRLDHTDDLEQALRWVLDMEKGSCSVFFWKEPGKEDYWNEEGKYVYLRFLISECPVRDACLVCGVPLGGTHCQATHGYWAGLLESVFSRKVDLFTERAGFGSCLIRLRTAAGSA